MNSKFITLLGILILLRTNIFAGTIRIATYNVETYLDQPTESRHFAKSEAAKAKICELIHNINPDVIAFEEMGTTNALLELQGRLKSKGHDFPFWEHVQGYDTNIHIAILSQLPIIARQPHTNENFLLDGRRFRVSRGFAEVEIRAATNFTFTLIAAHLKSRRPIAQADESELRLQEAKILRGIVDEKFARNPDAKLVVLGDFNDVKNSASTKAVVGRGKFKLTDTRPAERNGDNSPSENPQHEPRTVTWTHYYGLEDTYSRIDFIFLSPALTRHWVKDETYIPTISNWGSGSDHRLITAAFSID